MLTFLTQTSIDSIHIVFSYLFIVFTYSFTLISRKLYYKVYKKRDFLAIPKLKIKSISGISMMTAMNIALIITISMLSNQIMGIFFKVYPGARFLIENILIKLGGIIFGPIIGIFIGFTTDLLTVILTSSVLNYGYFFSAMMNGFLGGLIHILLRFRDPTRRKHALAAIGMGACSLIYLGIVLFLNSKGKSFNVTILSLTLSFHWLFIFFLITLVLTGCAIMLGLSVFAINKQEDPEYKDKKWIKYFVNKHIFFLILMSNCSIYLLVDIISLPVFDVKLSTLPYEQFLITRVITSLPAVIIFSYVIYCIYQLHLNIRRGDTSDELDYGLQPEVPKKKKTFLPTLIN